MDIFKDLGEGTVYGSTSNFVSDGSVTISLTAAALTDLNAAAGGQFAIGGALPVPLSNGQVQVLFFNNFKSPAFGDVQLQLDFAPAAVPEPTALSMASLAALAGLGLGWMKRRRAIG